MDARDRGYDLGDVSSGTLTSIGLNSLSALEAAYRVYEPRLTELGCKSDREFWAAIPKAQINQFIREFRERLSDFFELLSTVMAEMEAEIKQLRKPPQASGPASGPQQES